MGVTLTKYCEGKTAFKRLKLDSSTHFSLNDTDDSNQISPFTYSVWENLPYVALVEIYRLLPNKDKFNLSLTCWAWSRPFSTPEVWRHAKFLFNGIEDWRALHFARSLSSGLRHLVIEREDTEDMTYETSFSLHTFLDSLLRCNNCRLISLRIISQFNVCPLYQLLQFFNNQIILNVLGDVLSIQTRLKLLDLSWASFNAEQGLYILSRSALSCAPTITILAIEELFSRYMPPSTTDWLQAYTRLSELSISHHQLSDDLLNSLAVTGSLMHLNVLAEELTYGPDLTSDAWEHLKRSCPSLEARYCILKDVWPYYHLKYILVPGIPLVHLEWCLNDWGLPYEDTCEPIAANFQNYLRRVELNMCGPILWENRLLDCIILKCLLLEEISITVRGYTNVSLQKSIERSVRKALARQPASRLHRFTFNGEEIKLELTWIGSMSHWLLDIID